MIELAIAGGIGGLVKSLLEGKGRVALPSFEKVTDAANQTVSYVHLGFLVNVVLGTAVAYFTTTDIMGAFTAGMATAFFAEKASELAVK